MPGGFAGGMRSRPAPQLFAVPRLAEKEMCAAAEKEAPDFDAVDIANMDDIMTSIDQLIEGGSGDTPNASMCLGQTTDLKLPAALLQQASIWGAINPSDPLEGHKPAALFSGKGGQYDTGIAVRPPTAGAREEDGPPRGEAAPPRAEIEWIPASMPLITKDAFGVPVHVACPALEAEGFQANVRLHPPLLFWAARHQWMWHRKWTVPTIIIEVSKNGQPVTGPLPELHAMVTAGTLPEGCESLQDEGLLGECQSRVLLDSHGRGMVRFPRLRFMYTSFNCGSRDFHLVVTLMADHAAPGGAAPGGSASGPMGMPMDVSMGMDGTPIGGGMTRQVLSTHRSEPIHVDARKRSKGERAEAAHDDVRLVSRQYVGRGGKDAQHNPNVPGGLLPGGGAQAGGDRQAALEWLMRAGGVNAVRKFGGAPGQEHQQASALQLAPPNNPGAAMDAMRPRVPDMATQVPSNTSAMQQRFGKTFEVAPPTMLLDSAVNGWLSKGDSTSDAIYHVKCDSTVIDIVSSAAFGYTSQQLVGQTLTAVTLPLEREELLNALQVLVRMDEINRLSGLGGPAPIIRIVHHVYMGLGDLYRAPEVVTVDSLVKVVDTQAAGGLGGLPTATLLIRSRRATGPDAVGPFRMLSLP